MLTKSQYDQNTQYQLVSAIENIVKFQEMNKKLQLKSFEIKVDENLIKLHNQLIELQQKIKNSSGLLTFLRLDTQTIDLQSKIKQKLQHLYKQVHQCQNSIFCDANIINLQDPFVLEQNLIQGKIQFILNHPKYQSIGIIIEFQLREYNSIDKYKMVISKKFLIQKFKQYLQKNQYFENSWFKKKFFEKAQFNNQYETALMTLSYNFAKQSLFFLVENDPYIIVSNSSKTKIYLDKGMLLIFDDFYQLKVSQINTINKQRQHLSSSKQNQLEKSEGRIKINGYGYIQFEFVALQNKKFDIYLKNSSLDLSSYIQGIQAILYHDNNGFYIMPSPKSNPYKIFYHEKLITNDGKINVAIQLKNKVWVEIELDKKAMDQILL